MRAWRKLESSVVTSERLSTVSDSAKWLFTLLLVAQDDEGEYPWTATMIRSLTVTTTWDSETCESLLSELRDAGVTELRDGSVVLRKGAEKNGTPANSKKYVMLYPLVSESYGESGASRERVDAESPTIVQSRVDKIRVDKKVWLPPDWFLPLTELSGYIQKNYSKKAKGIEAACMESKADPAEVIKGFAQQWPTLKLQYNWNDPVATLKGVPLEIAISKSKNGTRNGSASRSHANDSGEPTVYRPRGDGLGS